MTFPAELSAAFAKAVASRGHTISMGKVLFAAFLLSTHAMPSGEPALHRVAMEPESLLFVSNRDSNVQRVGIFSTKADGSETRRLSPRDAVFDFDPDLSPDGSRIAFAGWNGREDYSFSISVMRADGSERRELTHGAEMACAPVWSPDGRQLAFCDMNIWTGNMEVFLIDADGSNRRKLVDGIFPFWSPDGKRIGFAASPTKGRQDAFRLHVIRVDGGDPEPLVEDGYFMGEWSPDGRMLVYVGKFTGGNTELCVVNSDGSGKRQLTDSEEAEFSPHWSADGRQVYFVRFPITKRPEIIWNLGEGNESELFVIDADGRNERRLTNNNAFDFLRGGAFVVGISQPINPDRKLPKP